MFFSVWCPNVKYNERRFKVIDTKMLSWISCVTRHDCIRNGKIASIVKKLQERDLNNTEMSFVLVKANLKNWSGRRGDQNDVWSKIRLIRKTKWFGNLSTPSISSIWPSKMTESIKMSPIRFWTAQRLKSKKITLKYHFSPEKIWYYINYLGDVSCILTV